MIPCFKCEHLLEDLPSLLLHFQEHRMTPIDPVPCIYCPRSFTNQRFFVKHFKRVHCQDSSEIRFSEASIEDQSSLFSEPLKTKVEKEEARPSVLSHANASQNSVQDDGNCSALLSDEQVLTILDDKILDFCAYMFSTPSLPLSHAQNIFKSVSSLIDGINSAYKLKIMNLFKTEGASSSTDIVKGMDRMFTSVESCMSSYKTKYRTLKMLKKKGLYTPPVSQLLGFLSRRRKVKGKFCVVRTKAVNVHIPLRQVLKDFLEKDDILLKILQYMDLLESEVRSISNVVQGRYWRNYKSHRKDRTILPLFLFSDDLELGNALGGHAGCQKVNASYCSIPCLMPEMRASLNNIFVTLITKSSHLKLFGNSRVFRPVVKDLQSLSRKGIPIQLSDGRTIRVYFQLSCLIGDNLGLNTIGGFSQNFSTSNYYCRFCKADKCMCKFLVKELAFLLRSSDEYESDLILNDASETGVKERCILNDLDDFHIFHNCGVDPMHDVYEGIAQYDMCFILKHYIYTAKKFSLDTFNERLATFNYGSADISNRPPPLPANFKKRKTLKMSASETACLLRYFGLLIGDLVPEDDEVFKLYIALRKIVSIIMSPSLDKEVCNLLSSLISEHHLLYIRLTGKPLTSKFHNLTHYPRLILLYGPVVHLSTMRWEGKHRLLKCICNATPCRINVCQTIACRCQMLQGYQASSKKLPDKISSIGRNETANNYDSFFDKIQQYTFTTPFPQTLRERSAVRTKWIKLNGTRYCEGNVLYVKIDEETSLPIFGLIQKIFVSDAGKVHFFLRNYRTVSFNPHYHAFELELVNSYSVFEYEEIHDFHPHSPISVLNVNFFVSLLYDQ